MSKWQNKKISELGTVVSGGTPSREIPEYWGDGYYWVTPTDITGTKGIFLESSKESITELGLKNSSAKMLPAGTILMTSRATLGESKISNVPVCTNQGFKSIIVNNNVSNQFLRYSLIFNKNKYTNLGIGTTFLEVNKSDTDRFEVFIPDDIREQKKIAQILSSVDEQIELTEKLIEKKREVKNGLLVDFYASPIVQKSPLFKIKDLAKDGLFIDGDWVELPHISESGIRFLQTGNIGIGKFINKNKNFIFESSFEKLNCTEVLEGDILICRLAEPAGRACIAPKSSERMITSVDVAILRIVNPDIAPEYINYALNVQQQLNKVELLTAGSTRKRISRKNLGMMELNIPAIEVQNKILSTLGAVDSEIESEERALEKLKLQKQGLMQDLLTGRVKVN
jgi:type I restriction enzyme S subunit